MGTDPFEEFEFKPLTEGLGFHNEKKPAMPTMAARGLDFTDEPAAVNPFKAPLPRRENAPAPKKMTPPAPEASAVDEILQTLHQSRKFEIEADRKHRQELRNPKVTETWKPAPPSFAAIFLDSMLITAASLLCMIVMLTVTKVDLLRNLSNPDTEGLVYAATVALFLGVTFIYMLVNRLFLGYTPGEWAYDIRLGKPGEQGHGIYGIQILFRQILVIGTGLITLPLIGAVVRRDIAGRLTGLSLMKRA